MEDFNPDERDVFDLENFMGEISDDSSLVELGSDSGVLSPSNESVCTDPNSNASPAVTSDIEQLIDRHQGMIDMLNYYKEHPEEFANLNKTDADSKRIANLLHWINMPEVQRILLYHNYEEYDNEDEGLFIQLTSKEFKAKHNFDEANFKFKGSGPQDNKLEKFGYLYKYYKGKDDKHHIMRKFYPAEGTQCIIVVFRETTHSITSSPSSSSEIKSDPVSPTTKKPRLGDYNGSSFYPNNYSAVPSSNNNNVVMQPINSTFINVNGSENVITNYQEVKSDPLVNNNNNGSNLTPKAPVDIQLVADKVEYIETAMTEVNIRLTKLELSDVQQQNKNSQNSVGPLTSDQTVICRAIIHVLRKNGNRFAKGSRLASKVREIVASKTIDTSTKVVNNLLYKVLAHSGIVQLEEDADWVIIDQHKADLL